MANNKNSAVFGGAISTSAVVILLLFILPFPVEFRQFFGFLLLVGWLLFGTRWLVQRYGRKVILVIMVLILAIGGAVGYAYWEDKPNRQLAEEIRQLRAYYV